jgi:preprotein translocase subunit SecF
MVQFFKDVSIDWLGNRRPLILLSVALMLVGLVSAVARQAIPGGTEAFNLGVDFKGGTVITVDFPGGAPQTERIIAALAEQGIHDAVVQPVTGRPEFLIKLPQMGGGDSTAASQGQVDVGGAKVRQALSSFGPEGQAYRVVGTEAVGPVAGEQLRNQAIAVTLAALVGILIYIAFRFEWTYGAAAVIAVFHDVLVTIGIFSIFQWEISLTVIAALLTLVGFSVNDTIVVFDRIRENLKLHRGEPLYKITNDAINQTLSRTIITSGLVFLSVLAMVLFGGDVLRGFSLALLIGIVVGTYSSVAIAAPIMVWWQQRIDAARAREVPVRESRAVQPRTSSARSAKAERAGGPQRGTAS